MPDWSQVSVIIPAFNEAASIGRVVQDISAAAAGAELIVVDDGSTDNTGDVARAAGMNVLRHPYNIGNGAAIKTAARASSRPILVFLDGDRQHEPGDLPKLVDALDGYEMAVGARTGATEEHWLRRLGNFWMNRLASFLAEMPIADLTSGFRAVRRERFMEFLHLLPNRYSYPTTITLCMIRAGYPVKYVPLTHARRRRRGRSHIRPLRDGLRFVILMLRVIMLFDPLKIFLPISLALVTLGAVLFGYDLITLGRVEESVVVIAVVACLTFLFGLLADQLALLRRSR